MQFLHIIYCHIIERYDIILQRGEENMKANEHRIPLPNGLKTIAARSFVIRVIALLLYYALMTYYLIAKAGMLDRFHMDVNYVSRIVLLLVILYIPPLFFSKVIWYIKDRDFEGEVLEIKYERKTTLAAGLMGGGYIARHANQMLNSQFKTAVSAKVRLASGKEKWYEIRRYALDDPCVANLTVGNRVRHYKWCKYTQILDSGRHDVDCIFCGMYTDKKEDYCTKCGRLLIKDKGVCKAEDKPIWKIN